MKKMKKSLNILIGILTIIAIGVLIIIVYRYAQYQENEMQALEVVAQIEETFEKSKENNQKIEMEYKGYLVEGIIEIPSINVKSPILNETNEDSMQYSVTKFSGGKINSIGNYVIAGHNYLNGSMFGNLKQLEIGDDIKLTDLYNNTVIYKVLSIYSVKPNDTSVLDSTNKNAREVTLITCTKGRAERLIVKAQEIKN